MGANISVEDGAGDNGVRGEEEEDFCVKQNLVEVKRARILGARSALKLKC